MTKNHGKVRCCCEELCPCWWRRRGACSPLPLQEASSPGRLRLPSGGVPVDAGERAWPGPAGAGRGGVDRGGPVPPQQPREVAEDGVTYQKW